MASETLHEDAEKLGSDVVDQHRAIVSLMEELEAVDWYDQRAKATGNPELRAILEHNRDEEKEHAAMALEWIRRNDPKMNEHLKTYLFTEGVTRSKHKRPPVMAKAKAPRRTAASASAACARPEERNNEPSFSRARAGYTGRLDRDREGSQAHLACSSRSAPRRRPGGPLGGASDVDSAVRRSPRRRMPGTCRRACAASSRWSSCAFRLT